MIRLARWLFRLFRTHRPPDFVVGEPAHPYLMRWHILPRNWFFNIYLHRFLQSDSDRALHDHPYCSVSLILDGIYLEHQIQYGGVHTQDFYQTGDVVLRGARHTHRLELIDGECWTLFITGPRIREWGFHLPGGWIPWYDFVEPHESGNRSKK